jgi:Holliday junction resolvase
MSICHNKKYENEFVNLMVKEGHHCERIAGSGSNKNSVCDCILFKEGKVYLVEVKATKEAKFYYRANIKEQLRIMSEKAKKLQVKALLAIKYKYKGWEFEEI